MPLPRVCGEGGRSRQTITAGSPPVQHQSRIAGGSATPATQSEGGCHEVPRLPRKTKVDVAKCHACHARRRGAHGNPLRHQSPPSAVSATPATQSEGGCHQVPRLPRCGMTSCVWASCVWASCVWTSCVWARCERASCVRTSCVWASCVWTSCVWARCVRASCVRTSCVWASCVWASCVWTSCVWASCKLCEDKLCVSKEQVVWGQVVCEQVVCE